MWRRCLESKNIVRHAHWGYEFPVGGVAALDPDGGGVVSAGGVGLIQLLADHRRLVSSLLFQFLARFQFRSEYSSYDKGTLAR